MLSATKDAGEKLEELRRAAGLSRHRLAVHLGINPSTYYRWVQGRTEPNARHIRRLHSLAKQFQVPLDMLFEE